MEFLMNVFFPFLIYLLGSGLLLTLIILIIRLIKTLGKIDKVVDDVTYKSSKLNGIFDLIDNATDTVSLLGDKLATKIVSKITNIFDRRKKEEENE